MSSAHTDAEFYQQCFKVFMDHVKIGDASITAVPPKGGHCGYDRLPVTNNRYTLFVYCDGACLFRAVREYDGYIYLTHGDQPTRQLTVWDWPYIKDLYHEYRNRCNMQTV